MKSQNLFRWNRASLARYNDNAWQRQLNWNAVRAAKAALKVFEGKENDTA